MTPRELYIAAQAYNANKNDEITEKKHIIYMQSFLNRVMRFSKHPPTYERIFREPTKPMTDEQMYKVVVAMNKALGGNDLRRRDR